MPALNHTFSIFQLDFTDNLLSIIPYIKAKDVPPFGFRSDSEEQPNQSGFVVFWLSPFHDADIVGPQRKVFFFLSKEISSILNSCGNTEMVFDLSEHLARS